MSSNAQTELFERPESEGWKTFRAKNGPDVRYLTVDDRIVRVDIGCGELAVTSQTQDRNYTVIPGYGAVQERKGVGGKRFLGKLSMVRAILDERAKRKAAEAAAAEAKQREDEAVDRLLSQSVSPDPEPTVRPSLSRTKLCSQLERPKQPPIDFVPIYAGGEFSKKPAELIKHSDRFAKDELRVLEAALVMGRTSGVFYGERRLAQLANVHPKNLSAIRKSLSNRCLIRPTEERQSGCQVWQLLWNSDYYGPFRQRVVNSAPGVVNPRKGAGSTTNESKEDGGSTLKKRMREDKSPAGDALANQHANSDGGRSTESLSELEDENW